MKYVSITRNFRGFNYQTDWKEIEDWSNEMNNQKEKHNEIEWSILVNVRLGQPIYKYRRGQTEFENYLN